MPYVNTLTAEATADQVRDAIMAAGQYINGLAIGSERRDTDEADVRSAIQFIHTYDPVLTAFERGMAPTPVPVPGQGPSGATALLNPGFRSLGHMVVEDAAYVRLRDAHESGSTFATVDIRGSVFNHNEAYRTLVDSSVGAAGNVSGELLPQGTAVMPPPRQRRLFVRDVINVQETSLASVPYIREYNPETTVLGASSVAEGVAKPEVAINWDPDDAPVRKIAAWIPVTTEIIDDVPTLQGYINNRLTYSLAVREELQILNGSGASPQLKGILNFAGVQTQAFVTGDQAGTLGMAIGKIEAVDGEADAIAIEPITFWTMVTSRHATQFDNGYGTGAPYGNPSTTPWGLPTIRSRAVAANTAVVGSWRMGATLFDRMQTQVRVGNQHSDFFTTNKVAILAEERVALAVHRADFFCVATLA